MSEKPLLCKLCGKPVEEHHPFVADMPDGCVCDPGTWDYMPDPICDSYDGPGYCKRCAHDAACHKPKGGKQ